MILALPAALDSDRAIAWLPGGVAVSRRAFMREARALAVALPAARYAINLEQDRYRFMLAFTAALLRGQTNLLPPSQAPSLMQALHDQYPDHHAFGIAAATAHDDTAADIPAAQASAMVFTSGSTGTPLPYIKTWGTLCAIAAHGRARLLAGIDGANLVATVPSQHMYVLETAVMLALAADGATHAERPFFPADVRRVLAEIPAPRVLISTPVHLRKLLSSGVALPPLARVISATAPLPGEIAAQIERAWNSEVHEIYGCTEAGSIGTRRTVDGEDWTLYPQTRLSAEEGRTVLHAAHLPEAVPLADFVEPGAGDRFRLIGRCADLVKVAGKRASLAELTRLLLEIPGVEDGVLFMPAVRDEAEARPAGLVVAPSVSEKSILAALAQRLDPVFLPRPLKRVPALPRNELGKLPQAELRRLLEP